MSAIYVINDCLDGIFTAVYDSFLYNEQVIDLITNCEQVNFLNPYKKIEIDASKVVKVKNKLKSLLYTTNYNQIKVAFCSGDNKNT